MSLLNDYLAELRVIRNLGAAVPETSYYSVLATLFSTLGKKLKPKVIYLPHPQNTGAGIPDAGFFTATQIQRTTGTPTVGQRPARGILEAKPFNTNMDQLAASAQVENYLKHYNQVLITNLRQFRLLIWEGTHARVVETYTLAPSTDDLFLSATVQVHEALFPEFLNDAFVGSHQSQIPATWHGSSLPTHARLAHVQRCILCCRSRRSSTLLKSP